MAFQRENKKRKKKTKERRRLSLVGKDCVRFRFPGASARSFVKQRAHVPAPHGLHQWEAFNRLNWQLIVQFFFF